MVIKVDAGIGKVLALDEELVVATEKPPAVQCIRWSPDEGGSQTSTELLSRMTWIQKNSRVTDMVYDRAMSLAVWMTNDGRAYAVQRLSGQPKESGAPKRLFRGYGFHTPESEDSIATRAAINARFSLLAIGCASAAIHVYTARDYVGNIPLSHKLDCPVSILSTGKLSTLNYSPDGYCLFAGYEKGWALWSVYGKLQASSFTSNPEISEANREGWLQGVHEAAWLHTGPYILLTRHNDHRLFLMEMAKSAVTGCFCSANISRTVLLTNTSLMIYRGYDLPVSTTISADATLWHHVQIPPTYLSNQRPIRSSVISPDGRYIAIAGRRGLAHYSVTSGRWKTFDDMQAENAFVVRGGMCWYQHILIAAVESDDRHEVSRHNKAQA
jgi:WD40 repeat protein